MTSGRHSRWAPAAGRGNSSRRTARRIGLAFLALLFLGIGGGALYFHEQGYRVWVVHTGSMEPLLMPGDVVIDSKPTGQYQVGQVITFLHSYQQSDVVTHRIKAISPDGTIFTKGDANRSADAWQINPAQVQGTLRHTVKYLGYALVFLQQPAGIGSLATGVLALVLLWRIFFPPSASESATAGADSESWSFDLDLAGSTA